MVYMPQEAQGKNRKLAPTVSWFQEHIRTKRGRVCNLNWAEFLDCTKN